MASCHVPWFYAFVTPYESPLCCMMEGKAQHDAYLQYNQTYGPWAFLEKDYVRWWNEPGFVKAREHIAVSADGCGPHRRCARMIGTEQGLRDFYSFPGAPEPFQKNLEAAIQSMLSGETTVSHFPLHWAITTGYACPNSCRHCYQVANRTSNDRCIPVERAEALAAMAPYSRYWELTGGEPLAMPSEILDLLLPNYPQLTISLFTSLNVPMAKIERYAPKAFLLNVSVDGCTQETYEYIKRGASYQHLLEAACWLRGADARMHGVFVLMGSNVEELGQAPDFYRELGFQSITVSRMIPSGNPEADNENIYVHDADMDRRIEAQFNIARERARELKLGFVDQGIASYLNEPTVPGP